MGHARSIEQVPLVCVEEIMLTNVCKGYIYPARTLLNSNFIADRLRCSRGEDSEDLPEIAATCILLPVTCTVFTGMPICFLLERDRRFCGSASANAKTYIAPLYHADCHFSQSA